MGISIADLDLLTIGLVIDMYTESANDHQDYDEMATQEEMDRYKRQKE